MRVDPGRAQRIGPKSGRRFSDKSDAQSKEIARHPWIPIQSSPRCRRPVFRRIANEREGAAASPGDHRQMPLDERFRPQSGYLGQHLGAFRQADADHTQRHAL